MIKLPELCKMNSDQFSNDTCAFIFAMGFEDRALSIPKIITECPTVNTVISIKYSAGTAKGQNKEAEAKRLFANSQKKLLK